MSDWSTVRDVVGLELRPIHQWPGKRTRDPEPSPFRVGLRDTLKMLTRELRNLSAKKVILQIAIREGGFRQDGLPRADARAEQPGVILSFESVHGPLSLPCDTFRNWQDNLRAIAFHLEHLRHASLYGVGRYGEQYRGWKALPEGNGVGSREDAEALIRGLAGVSGDEKLGPAYRAAVRRCHPDVGGDPDTFHRLQAAWEVVSR